MLPISGKTRLIGLIGWPVAHSLSPAMHNTAAAALGLDWVYVPLPVRPEAVATAVPALPALGFRGVNVTIPHKQAVIPFLDEVEPAAWAIGAVNTIVVEAVDKGPGTRLVGYNTDGAGFLADLQTMGVAVKGRDCLVLGAGGSARAVVYALLKAGGRLTVLARRPAQAGELAADVAPAGRVIIRPLAELPAAAAASHSPLILNTTPLGMAPQVDRSPWPDDLPFPTGAFVYDLVYNPAETKLMRQAQAAGCRASNGLGMLVQQGARAFALWTGHEPDVTVMRAAISRQAAG